MITLGQDQMTRFDEDGFLVVARLVDADTVAVLRARFARLFRGEFETGVRPDEVNWQEATGDPSLTRQICNAWKADRAVARVVLDQSIGRALAELAGWPGARVIQDNMLWKPPGARSLGYHQDNAYLAWYTPREMLSCWIALDDTSAEGGTVEFARGSHRWARAEGPTGEFHGPKDYRAPLERAASAEGVAPEIVPVEVPAGGGAFHHGWTWHGSGPNRGGGPRRLLGGALRAGAPGRGQRPGLRPLPAPGRRHHGRQSLPHPLDPRRAQDEGVGEVCQRLGAGGLCQRLGAGRPYSSTFL
jgi:ectoine hydroxylase-related dioxygenase (phytanoyl-CoA dioxygenase family)